MNNKIKIMQGIVSIVVLIVEFIICRYILFDMHGMKEYPMYLFILGVIVLLIAAFLKSRFVATLTVLGYIMGFVYSTSFGSDKDWLVWGIIYIIFIALGIFVEVEHRKKLEKARLNKNK